MTLRAINIKTILTGVILLVSMVYGSNCSAQSKADYTWIWSSNPEPLPNKEGAIMTFNNQKRKVLYKELPYAISSNNTIISDQNGDLLFYSNGCQIINKEHGLMVNGDSINYGQFWEDFTSDCADGYPVFQNSIILNDPGKAGGYFLIHKTLEYSVSPQGIELYVPALKYSYIDMTLNDDLGEVTIKNQEFFTPDSLISSYLTAIKHQNNVDWWIIQMLENTNEYVKILLSNNGFEVRDTQRLGPIFNRFSSASGQAKFSPDGKNFALYNNFQGLLLYDFDRNSGQLSNLQQAIPLSNNLFSGMEFSSNSRFIYLSTEDSLWQVDLLEKDWAANIELIDTWDGLNDPAPTNFILMQLGPDCIIYMTSGNSTKSIHVINQPNEKGQVCNFVQHGLSLPYSNNPFSIPNFPRLRVDEDNVCDPTITSVFGVQVEPLKRLTISPNPAHDKVFVEIPSDLTFPLQLEVLDFTGKQVYSRTINKNDLVFLDVSSFSTGVYLIDIRDKSGKRAVSNLSII